MSPPSLRKRNLPSQGKRAPRDFSRSLRGSGSAGGERSLRGRGSCGTEFDQGDFGRKGEFECQMAGFRAQTKREDAIFWDDDDDDTLCTFWSEDFFVRV